MFLPINPRPFKDELLSSWVTRLAIENGLYTHAFYKGIYGLDPTIFTRDIDRLYVPQLVTTLESQTGLNINEIKSLMLTHFEGRVFESININGYSRWILPLGIYHRTRQCRGVQYCPQCLSSSTGRYYKKQWRLSFYLMCEQHHCLLRDTCPHCNSAVDYQRIGIGNWKYETPYTDMSLCSNCELPLWDCPPQTISPELEPLLGAYMSFLQRFDAHKPCIPQLQQPLEIQEFSGLWELISGLMKKRYFESGIKRNIEQTLGIEINRTNTNQSFDQRSAEERLKIFLVTLWLIDDWPERLITISNNTKFSKSAFSDFSAPLCFWLSKVVHSQFDKSTYTANLEEIEYLVRYLRKHGLIPTNRTICHFTNMHIGTLRNKVGSNQYSDPQTAHKKKSCRK